MNRPLVAAGLVLLIGAFVVYVARAVHLKKKPNLATAVHVGIAAAAIPGAIRLIGFPFTEDFLKLVLTTDTSWWSLSGEDGIFMVIGGLAIAWVSVATICAAFSKE